MADDSFVADRTFSGLASGEGLIATLQDSEGDAAADKRALVMEPEFARVLTVAKRDGSTLSPVIREAWDHGDLRVMTRAHPLHVTGAHIGVIAHITVEELRKKLVDAEVANGFANRFLFVCSKRSKVLPEGRGVPRQDLRRLGRLLRSILEEARSVDQLTRRNARARTRWAAFYRECAETAAPGLLGAVTARAEAQCLRLSVIYALLDRSNRISARHIEAAIAVWRYSEASCAYLFRDASGNDVVDRLLNELRRVYPEPLSGTQQRNLFSRHVDAHHIATARSQLESLGLAHTETVRTRGRSLLQTYASAESAESAESR